MKQLFSCGLYQKRTPSTSIIARISTSTTKFKLSATKPMAAADNNQIQWYTIECNHTLFTLPVRYQDVKYIGHGAFGAVVRATDTVTGKTVAIKKLLQPFRTITHAKRTFREIRLLNYLNHADANVVQLYNIFTPDASLEEFQSLYLVFNFVHFDVHRVIRRHLPFAEDHIQQIIYSVLRGLKFIHSAHIIHRDIKPANIGIDAGSNVTLFDFGLARVASQGLKTGYVATRWWRAPEVFISWEQYNEKLDIWSVGCVIAELILLKPLFPGSDYVDQLRRILNVVGTPDVATLEALCQPRPREFIMELDASPRADFNALFGYKYHPDTHERVSGVSEEGVNFISRLLDFDNRSRPTVAEALAHPFLSKYHDPASEPTIAPIADEYENATYDMATWKAMIWGSIQTFTPPPWATEVILNAQ